MGWTFKGKAHAITPKDEAHADAIRKDVEKSGRATDCTDGGGVCGPWKDGFCSKCGQQTG